MSRYNTIIPNDVVNGRGVCVSFWAQGCPHRCPGCFNEETWDFDEGQEYTSEIKWNIIKAISANNIQRNFSVLGGEPLALQNIEMTKEVIDAVRHAYPNIEITVWTGYTMEEIQKDKRMKDTLSEANVLIEGPFIEDLKDLNLRLRGSSNQHIWKQLNNKWEMEE